MKQFTRLSGAILIGFILSAGTLVSLSLLPAKNTFALKWDHPQDYRADSTLSFVIYTSGKLTNPISNWSVYTNISGANAWLNETNGTNFVYGISNCPAAVAQQFFFATASNFYGESLPSNTVTSAPALMPIVTNSTRILRQ